MVSFNKDITETNITKENPGFFILDRIQGFITSFSLFHESNPAAQILQSCLLLSESKLIPPP